MVPNKVLERFARHLERKVIPTIAYNEALVWALTCDLFGPCEPDPYLQTLMFGMAESMAQGGR